MNRLEPEDIEFKLLYSMGFTTYHHAKYINVEFGVEMEKVTRKKDEGFGKSKIYYFISGQTKVYTNLEELCNDWNEIKNYDDPNSEIEWVKVIKTKGGGYRRHKMTR